jgi:hypothetical protein
MAMTTMAVTVAPRKYFDSLVISHLFGPKIYHDSPGEAFHVPLSSASCVDAAL